MNWRVGLFRLWIVLSAIYLSVVLVMFAPSVIEDFKAQYAADDGGVILVPLACGSVRGTKGADYTTLSDDSNCWYELSKFRALFPEYKSKSDDELTDKLYDNAGVKLAIPDPWGRLGNVLSALIVGPFVLLLLNFATKWIVTGFATPEKSLKQAQSPSA
jgi:hypothetical protein